MPFCIMDLPHIPYYSIKKFGLYLYLYYFCIIKAKTTAAQFHPSCLAADKQCCKVHYISKNN